MFKRSIAEGICRRFAEERRFFQVLVGPRQTGKTTLARQVMEDFGPACHYAAADEPAFKGAGWIEQQWGVARMKARDAGGQGVLLVLDEIQKVPAWSETAKRLWDEDTAARRPVKALLLGSSPLLLQTGLTESLAGRFEILSVGHWSYVEMRQAFGWTAEQYVFYGGYPGGAGLVSDAARWFAYIRDSLIETTIARDILLMRRVDRPALLRRLFDLGCLCSGQVLSYTKMLGQLQDTGNTTTLAHYLDLLAGAGMLTGLQKFSGSAMRQRGSSPKLQVLNTALMTALTGRPFAEARQDGEYWGRLVESAVGAHLAAGLQGRGVEIFYWRDGNQEVDFVLRRGDRLAAIEVKSGRPRTALPGMEAFARAHPQAKKWLIGTQGLPWEEFLGLPPEVLLE